MTRLSLLSLAACAALSLVASPAFAELDSMTAAKVQRLEKLAEQGSFDVVVKTAREALKGAEGEASDVLNFHLARGLQRTHANAEAVALLMPLVVKGGALAAEAAEVLKLAGSELADEDVEIDGTVAGATVLVDGDDVGTTPAAFKLKPGVYKVEVTKDGFVGAGTTLQVLPGQGATFNAGLKATGGVLIVEADVAGLEILVDGSPRTATGVTTRLDVPARELKVALRSGGQVLKTETLDFTLGGTQTVSLRKFALLKLKGAEGATVLVDGQASPVEDGAVKLEAGEHKVRVERKGFHPVETTVAALPGRDLSGSADLVAVSADTRLTPYLWAGAGVGAAMVLSAVLVDAFVDLDGTGSDVVLGAVGGTGALLFCGSGFWLKSNHDALNSPELHEGGLQIAVLPTAHGVAMALGGSF